MAVKSIVDAPLKYRPEPNMCFLCYGAVMLLRSRAVALKQSHASLGDTDGC